MMDSLLVNLYTYYKPLGFDITNVYKVNIGKMSPEIPGYVPDSLLTTTDGEDLVRLVDNIRRAPQVDEICLADEFLSVYLVEQLVPVGTGGC